MKFFPFIFHFVSQFECVRVLIIYDFQLRMKALNTSDAFHEYLIEINRFIDERGYLALIEMIGTIVGACRHI